MTVVGQKSCYFQHVSIMSIKIHVEHTTLKFLEAISTSIRHVKGNFIYINSHNQHFLTRQCINLKLNTRFIINTVSSKLIRNSTCTRSVLFWTLIWVSDFSVSWLQLQSKNSYTWINAFQKLSYSLSVLRNRECVFIKNQIILIM